MVGNGDGNGDGEREREKKAPDDTWYYGQSCKLTTMTPLKTIESG